MVKVNYVFRKIILWLLILLLFLSLCGVVVYFVAKNKGVSFSVQYDDEYYFSNLNDMELTFSPGKEYVFQISYLGLGDFNYEISITSNLDNNFSFVCEGQMYDFFNENDSNHNDYSDIFNLSKNVDNFSFKLSKDCETINDIVSEKFGGSVELQKELIVDNAYFVINVDSGNSHLKIYLTFCNVTSIELSAESYVF